MDIRDKLVESALSWVDTPYHHHARVKGVGVDCAQLIVGIALDCGLMTEEQAATIPNYPVQWHLHNREEKLLEMLDGYGCVQRPSAYACVGDIITFKFGRVSSHLGICINDTQFIHADKTAGKVVCVSLNDEWSKRWTHVYEFPGVNNG